MLLGTEMTNQDSTISGILSLKAVQPLRRLVHVDAGWSRRCRDFAQKAPVSLRSFALVIFSSFLIWGGPKWFDQLSKLIERLTCIRRPLGEWLGVVCTAKESAIGIILSLVFLGVAIWLVARLFGGFASVIVSSTADLVKPHDRPSRVLIMGLSLADDEAAIDEARAWCDRWESYTGDAKTWKAANGEIAATAKAGPWQQAARMVAVHLQGGRLERIYVLPSEDSLLLFEAYRTYLQLLFRRALDVRLIEKDGRPFADLRPGHEHRRRSYENYSYLREGLLHGVSTAKQEFADLKDSDICIDATAGMKMFSIAAAVVTLDRNILLGYVVSRGRAKIENSENGVVKIYDARIEPIGAVANKLRESF